MLSQVHVWASPLPSLSCSQFTCPGEGRLAVAPFTPYDLSSPTPSLVPLLLVGRELDSSVLAGPKLPPAASHCPSPTAMGHDTPASWAPLRGAAAVSPQPKEDRRELPSRPSFTQNSWLSPLFRPALHLCP